MNINRRAVICPVEWKLFPAAADIDGNDVTLELVGYLERIICNVGYDSSA